MLPLCVALLSLSGVSLVALFEAGGRVSVRRKHGMKTGEIRVVDRIQNRPLEAALPQPRRVREPSLLRHAAEPRDESEVALGKWY